jgi:hypothetical protein
MPIGFGRLAAALCTMLTAAPAWGAQYTATRLKMAGDRPVEIDGITAGGEIYGYLGIKSGVLRAFTILNGQTTLHDVGKPRFLEVQANDSGQIAGLEVLGPSVYLFREVNGSIRRKRSLTSLAIGLDSAGDLFGTGDGAKGNPEYTHGMEWVAGQKGVTRFKVPGSDGTFFSHVNAAGTVAGHYTTDGGRSLTGFTLAAGQTQVTPVSVPDYTQSNVVGINDAGSLAVTAQNANGETGAFLDVAGNFTQIAPPGAVAVNLQGVNNQNLAYGMYETADKAFHPFVYSAGTYISFKPPPGTHFDFYSLRGMDANGNLVGYADGKASAIYFVATCNGTGC